MPSHCGCNLQNTEMCKEENPNQSKIEQLNRVKLLNFKIFLIIGDS